MAINKAVHLKSNIRHKVQLWTYVFYFIAKELKEPEWEYSSSGRDFTVLSQVVEEQEQV